MCHNLNEVCTDFFLRLINIFLNLLPVLMCWLTEFALVAFYTIVLKLNNLPLVLPNDILNVIKCLRAVKMAF